MTNIVSQQPDPSDHSHRGLRAPTIECQICQAIYAPAEEYRYLVQAPQVALESAFMSMCHFCFRCRRPACPQCWDHAHGVCGACSQEANLPFRSQTAPLRGVLFPTTRQEQLRRKQTEDIRLHCINPGRFQTLAPIDETETTPYLRKNIRQTSNTPQQQSTTYSVPSQPAYTTITPPRNYPRARNVAPHHTSLIAPASPPAPVRQAVRSVRPQKTGTAQFANSTDMLYPVPVPPLPHGKLTVSSTAARTGSLHTAAAPLASPQRLTQTNTNVHAAPSSQSMTASTEAVTRPEPPMSKRITKKIGQPRITKKIDTTTTSAQAARPSQSQQERSYQDNRQTAATRRKTRGQLVEALITYLLTAVLVGILLLIILAVISPAANTTIRQLLHIDIHTELLNLWQFIRQ